MLALSYQHKPRRRASARFPAWNVGEDERSFRVEVELPGFCRDDIDLHLEGGSLRITGSRHGTQPDDKTTYHHRERFVGKFSRTLRLGAPIEPDQVEAVFKDGILTVTLPKSEASLPRKIRVNEATEPSSGAKERVSS